ncbi:MAG: SGNH/GDSL hydrolase family protein [bacterium]
MALVPATGAAFCLPPLTTGGYRLAEAPNPAALWLELTLRQHELCSRSAAQPQEVRVAVFGNSAVYGFPLASTQGFTHLLNEDFAAQGVPAHLYNLAFPGTYQLRDAVTMHAALPYRPDVLVYPVTLSDLDTVVPTLYAPVARFFDSNFDAMAEMELEPPLGLEEPMQRYAWPVAVMQQRNHWLDRWREIGAYVRGTLKYQATRLAGALAPPAPWKMPPTRGRQTSYDCAATQRDFDREFEDWQSWNILAYLEDLQANFGLRVVVVNWPVAHEPVGDCYNVRFPAAAVQEFNDWLGRETAQRGLIYVDLHDLLPADQFFDSLHVTAAGHQMIAAALRYRLLSAVAEARTRQDRRPEIDLTPAAAAAHSPS